MKNHLEKYEKKGRFILPLDRLRGYCQENIVFKSAFEDMVSACGIYARAIQKEAYPRPVELAVSDALMEEIAEKLYKEDQSLENNFADSLAEFLRVLGMKGINETEILKNLQSHLEYARCALETATLFDNKEKEIPKTG